MAESADVLCAPHQQVILPDLAAGCSMADMAAPEQLETCWDELEQMGIATGRRAGRRPGHLHQLGGVDQSVLRRARRRRLHLVERGGDAEVGVGARRARFCSCPISISAATPPTRWACRSTRWCVWDPNEICGGLEPDAVEARADDPVEGPLLGPRALHRAADREASARSIPASASSSTPKCRGTSCRRPTTPASTEYIIKTVTQQPGRIGLGGRHRDPPRQPARAAGRARPHRPLARSVRLPLLDDVPRLAEPPALDPRRAASTARSTTASSCRTTRSTGRRSRSTGCCPSRSDSSHDPRF